ncbi:TonB-dependent receptor [candidate division KSB1 bacterium]|nr:TonB-dependent receptor [candidate division KSB1 bacterium]
MFKRILPSFVICLLFITGVLAASNNRIVGVVVNEQTGEPLPRANIVRTDTGSGCVSDHRGEFVLSSIQEPVELHVSYMGFQPLRIRIDPRAQKSQNIRIALQPTIVPLQGVVVTSNKFEQDANEVSYPLSVVRAEQIRDRSPITLSNALNTEPGITLSRDGIWGTHVSIRGLSKSRLVTLVDGNRIDTATDLAAGMSMIDVHDIERIEVIKGAASVLYGSGAIGGAVNIVTRDGWYQDGFYLTGHLAGGYGSVNGMGGGWMTVNAGDSRWYTKISGSVRKAGDTQTPQGTLTNSGFADNNLSARLGIRIGKQHELLANLQRYRATDVGLPGGYPIFPAQATVSYPREERDLIGVEYIGRNLNSNLLKLSFRVFQQDILRDVLNIPHIVQEIPAQNGMPAKRVNVLEIAPGATHQTRGAQVQTDWRIGARHYLIAGTDSWQKEYNGWRTKTTRIEMLSPVDLSVMKQVMQTQGELPLPNSTYRSIGIFAQDQMTFFGERLQLTLGGRHDWIHTENDRALNPDYQIVDGVRNDSPAGQTLMWEATSAENRSWSGTLSGLLRVSRMNELTLTLGRAFRSPSLEERYQYIDLGSLVKIGDPYLQPEYGTFFDFGWRYRNLPFALSANLFANRLNNLVAQLPGIYEERPALINSNIDQALLYGVDARADYALSSGITVYGTIAYVVGKNRSNKTPLPAIAPLNGTIGFSASPASFFSIEALSNLYADQDRVVEGELRTPGYAVFDLYVRSRPFRLAALNGRLILGIENLFDRFYRNHLATNRGWITAEPGRNFIGQYVLSF